MLPKLFRRNSMRGLTPWQFYLRAAALVCAAAVACVLIMVAALPLAWVLLPVAVLVLPFIIPAFFPEATHGEHVSADHEASSSHSKSHG